MNIRKNPDNQLGVAAIAMAFAMSLIPIGDSIAKYISEIADYSPGFLAWSRFVIGGAVLIPIAWVRGSFKGLGREFYFRQAVRGFFISMTLIFIITAVSLSPLADVFGAFFIGPVIATLLSIVLLKEQATLLEWLAVILGFVGVLLVVQPGMGAGDLAGNGAMVDNGFLSRGLLFALAAGVFYGSFLTATRWSAGMGPPLAQLAVQLLFGLIFIAPLGITDLLQHGLQATAPVLLMGATSAAANFFSIIALARAPATYLAPVVYLQIVVATLISIVFFNDTLNTLAMAGLAIIVFTGFLKIRPRFWKALWANCKTF